MNKIMSFLSPYIPIGLAMKGLEKISPKMKSFFGGSLAAGYTANEAMDYLRKEFSSQGQKETRSIDENARPDELAAKARLSHEEQPSRIAQSVGAAGLGALGGVGAAALTGATQAANQISDQPEAKQASQHPGGFLEFIKQNPELGSYLDSLMQKGADPIQAATQAKQHRKFRPLVESIEKKMGQSFEDLLAQLFQGTQSPQGQRSQASPGQSIQQGNNQSGGDSELISALQQILKM